MRPAYDFAPRAIIAGADTPSEPARRMSVTRQAAAKMIATLDERRYVERAPDPRDGRRLRLTVTGHGSGMLRIGESIFDDIRAQWERQAGAAQIDAWEAALRDLVGESADNWATNDFEG